MSEDTALVTTQVFNREQLDLMKRTVATGLSDDEFSLFVMQANRLQLDPFNRQIHAVKRWNSKMGKEVMAIQVAIDGSRAIADRTGNYAPGREPSYAYRTDSSLESATSYVTKLVKGTWHEVAATAFWDEYVQVGKDGMPTSFWKKMPHLMLAKVAEALALRKAFPEQLSGVFTDDEMMQADNVVEGIVTSSHDGVREQVKKDLKELVADNKAWLDVNKKNAATSATGNSTNIAPNDTRHQLITLLGAAPDDKFITMPIVNPLKQYMAEAGYADKEGIPNMFHINGLLKKMTGHEMQTLNGLTGKQAKSLVNYCAYLIENGGDVAKDFAQQVLTRAWADNCSWKEACDKIASKAIDTESGEVIDLMTGLNLDSICIRMGTTLANVTEALSACGWPDPLSVEKQLVDFLKVCKDKGFPLKVGEDYTRFEKVPTLLALSVAQREGWVKPENREIHEETNWRLSTTPNRKDG